MAFLERARERLVPDQTQEQFEHWVTELQRWEAEYALAEERFEAERLADWRKKWTERDQGPSYLADVYELPEVHHFGKGGIR